MNEKKLSDFSKIKTFYYIKDTNKFEREASDWRRYVIKNLY